MAEVTPLKQLILVEEVETGASASEATMTKIAGSVNHAVTKNFLTCAFNLHGPYWITGVPDTNVDIEWIAPCDMEIVKIHFYHKDAGASGTCEVDVLKYPLAGGSASIFSTRPSISYTAGNGARVIVDYADETPTDVSVPSGCTAPRLSAFTVSENDVLKISFIQKQASPAEGVGLHLVMRAI
jgi:hypothetical protein